MVGKNASGMDSDIKNLEAVFPNKTSAKINSCLLDNKKAISELEKYVKNADFYMPTGYYIGKFVRFYHDKFMQIGKTDNNDECEKWQK